jgi:hypothetical protein
MKQRTRHAGTRSGDPMPTHPSTPTQPGPADLAGLDALAEALNERKLPSLLLHPPGQRPYVDTSPPHSMNPGLRIYADAGMFRWPDAQPIAPTSQPATAAAIIAHILQPSQPHLPPTTGRVIRRV